MKNVIVIIIILLLLAGTTNHLHAQEKSTALAMGLSIGIPLMSYCATEIGGLSPNVLVPSLFITPSLGHFYAGQWGRGILFISLRSMVVLGTYMALVSNISNNWYDIDHSMQTSLEIGLIGLSLCGAVTLMDWAFVPSSVEKYNERFHIEPQINLQNGNYGLGFSYRF